MGDRILQILITAKDETAQAFKSLGGSLKEAEDYSNKVAIGLGVAGTALGVFGFSAIKAAANVETQRLGFKTLLGNINAADEAIKMIQKDSAETPFEFSGLIEANKSLTFVTKNAQASEKVLLNVGKALSAAGKGQNELNSVIYNLQQIGNTGKITEMDIRQFGFAGINILELLASYYGTTKAAAGDMVKESKNAFVDLSNAFEKAGSDGGQFANAFKDQAGTANQLVSNLRDSWNIFLQNEGAKLLEWWKLLNIKLIDFVQNVLPQVITRIENLTEWFSKHQFAIMMVAGAIIGALVPAIYAMAVAFVAAAIALAPFIIGGAIIAGLIAGIIWIVENWEMIKQKAGEIWGAIAAKLSEIWQGIKTAVSNIWNPIADYFSEVWNRIQGIFNFGLALIIGIMITFLDWIMPNWRSNFEKLKTFISESWQSIKFIFQTTLDAIKFIWETVWTAISNFLSPKIQFIRETISGALTWIKEAFITISTPIKDAWGAIWDGLKDKAVSAWDGIKDVIKESINWIIDKINWFIGAANSTAVKGAGALGISIPSLSSIPRLAMGGIVTQPTIAMIGEAGPEAVIPLSRNLENGLGRQIIINITGNTLLDSRAAEKIGDMIIGKLKLNFKY